MARWLIVVAVTAVAALQLAVTETAAARMKATISPKEIARATLMTVVIVLTRKTEPW